MHTKIGVGVLIEHDNKILLGHRVNNYKDTGGIYEPDTWTVPGGKLEYMEKLEDCGKREVKEETNLDVSKFELLDTTDDIGIDRHFITVHFLAQEMAGELKVMEPTKIDEWKWFSIDELPENIYSPTKKTISAYKTYKKTR